MSADWSFNCIPLVESLQDPRNLATLGLYCTLVYWTLSAAPFSLAASRLQAWGSAFENAGGDSIAGSREQAKKGQKPQQQQQNGHGQTHQQQQEEEEDQTLQQQLVSSKGDRLWHARLRLVVVAGLLVGPFFPASNVLMYVGTFIGERLLYFPSVGYCWLLADLSGRLLPSPKAAKEASTAASRPHADATGVSDGTALLSKASDGCGGSGGTKSTSSSKGSSKLGSWGKAKGALLGLLLLLLLGGYSLRTWLRCFDWLNEEKLFLSAMKVCPDSCKVRLNTGIVFRRRQQWETALSHFR